MHDKIKRSDPFDNESIEFQVTSVNDTEEFGITGSRCVMPHLISYLRIRAFFDPNDESRKVRP
jgi:hypothetical protein